MSLNITTLWLTDSQPWCQVSLIRDHLHLGLSPLSSLLLQTSSQLKWMQRSHICVLFKEVCCAV